MKLFANAAAEIPDDQNPPFSRSSRYGDDSSNYAAGFAFAGQLNSAVFNGILHRITSVVNEKLHCNASNIPNFQPKSPFRYNSPAEIADPQYTDGTNYILAKYFDLFASSRISSKLLKEETVEDFFAPPKTGTYLPKPEAQRSKQLFCGTDLPPLIVTDYKTWDMRPPVGDDGFPAQKNRTHLFKISSGNPFSKYAKLTIPGLDENELSLFEVRNTVGTGNSKDYNQSLKTAVQFASQVYFQSKSIDITKTYLCTGRAFLVVKGNTILVADGLEVISPPALSVRESIRLFEKI